MNAQVRINLLILPLCANRLARKRPALIGFYRAIWLIPLPTGTISSTRDAQLGYLNLRRSNNQDSFTVVLAGDEDWLALAGHLLTVADGMGAHAAGELASKLACNGVAHTYHKLRDRAAAEALRQAIVETNAHIHGRGQANSEFQGMGTTTSVMVLLPQGA